VIGKGEQGESAVRVSTKSDGVGLFCTIIADANRWMR